MKQSRFRNYLLGLALTVLGGLALVAAINLVIDPYGYWGSPLVPKLNTSKTAQKDHELMFKAAELTRLRPRNLFLGSSRVDLGLDPHHPALKGKGRVYNLALFGGFIRPTLEYYRYALSLQPAMRHVVLGLEFATFNENVHDPSAFDDTRLRPGRTFADMRDTLLSRDALFDSVRTIAASPRAHAYRAYDDSGMGSEDDMRGYAEERGMPQRISTSVALYLNAPERYADYVPSRAAMDDFAEIVRLSREHGVDLKVFITPEHVVLLEALRLRGLWCTYLAWKSQLVQLTPVFDFSGYNAITTEPITPDMKFYWDAAHFRKGVGDLILDRLYGVKDAAIPDDFGVLVTPETLGAWDARVEAAQAAWEADNEAIIRWTASRMKPLANVSPAAAASAPHCPAENKPYASN